MASITLEPIAPLGGLDLQIGHNRVIEQVDLALVSIAIPLGGDDVLAQRLQDHWGLASPEPTQTSTCDDWRAVSMTADQIMLIGQGDRPTTEAEIAAKLNGTGYTTNQTSAWVCLEVSGPDTVAAFARICPINLALAAFPIGASARTMMDHLGALIIRLDDDCFQVLSASSSAASFAHAVETSYRNVT